MRNQAEESGDDAIHPLRALLDAEDIEEVIY
jgi:hypothetical protein